MCRHCRAARASGTVGDGNSTRIRLIYQNSISGKVVPQNLQSCGFGAKENIWPCLHLPTSLWSAPTSYLAIHGDSGGRENFPFPTWRLNLSVVTRQLGDLYRLEQFRKETSLFPFSLIRLLLALSSQRAAAALLFFLIPARNMKILQRAKRSLAGPVLRVPFKMCLQPVMGPPCWLSPCG